MCCQHRTPTPGRLDIRLERHIEQSRAFTTKDLAGAIAFASSLSYPMVADQLPPLLGKVLGRPPLFERSLRQLWQCSKIP
jgi:hypothetical protein